MCIHRTLTPPFTDSEACESYPVNYRQDSILLIHCRTRLQKLENEFVSLQEEVNQMKTMIRSSQTQSYRSSDDRGELRPTDNPISHAHESDIPYKRHRRKSTRNPLFVGPTSSVYSFDIGKSSLKSMGMQTDNDYMATEPDNTLNTPRSSPRPQGRKLSPLQRTLVQIGSEEALRLIDVY